MNVSGDTQGGGDSFKALQSLSKVGTKILQYRKFELLLHYQLPDQVLDVIKILNWI